MAGLKAKYVIERGGAFYWQPSAKMREAGFRPEALGRDPVAALARAGALATEWQAIRAGEKAEPEAIAQGTLTWAIRQYQGSTWWTGLQDSTREVAARHLAYIEASPLGRAHVRQLERPDIRDFYDKCAAARGIWKAHEVHKYLCRVLYYAVERGWIKLNPAAKMQIIEPPPRRVIWQPGDVAIFVAAAREKGFMGWARAVSIGYDSGQDLMVILGRQWSHFDGEGIDFRRTKTDIASWSPCEPLTMELLGEGEKTSTYICTTPFGRPINNRSYFGRVFRAIRDGAGLPPARFRDLRRTVGTEIYESGGRIEPTLGLTPGSPVQKHYIVPSKDAARVAAASRRSFRKAGEEKP